MDVRTGEVVTLLVSTVATFEGLLVKLVSRIRWCTDLVHTALESN